MHLLIIFLIYISLCSANSAFNAIARNFSVVLVEAIGSDHDLVCSFGIWSIMTSVAIWCRDSLNQGTTSRDRFIQDCVKLRNAVLDFEPNMSKMEYENFVFINKDFDVLPEFKDTMSTHFKAHIKIFTSLNSDKLNVAVKVANDANDVVRSVTPLFKHVFRPIHFTDFLMNMANVLIFSGTWTSPFETGLTTLNQMSGVKYKEKIMHQKIKIPYSYIEEIKANVMELSFGTTGKYSMLIIKPDPEVNVTETYKLLKIYNLMNVMDKLEKDVNDLGLKEIDLTLPTFRMESTFDLTKPLIDVGVDDVFKSDEGHFPGISNDDVYISSVEHKASIHLNETGVTAFASTPGKNFLPRSKETFNLKSSEPFIFFILEKPTVTVIFSGLYSRPYVY